MQSWNADGAVRTYKAHVKKKLSSASIIHYSSINWNPTN